MAAQNDQYVADMCQIVLDNMIMAIQMKEMDKESRENKDLQKARKMFSNQPKSSSQNWLHTVGQAYLQKSASFPIKEFNSFIDDFSQSQNTLSQRHQYFEDVFEIFNAKKKDRDTTTWRNFSSFEDFELTEVKGALDNMIFLLEIQEEIENQTRLDMSWMSIDRAIEKEIDKSLLKSPSKYKTTPQPKVLALTQSCQATTKINTSQIFNANYVKKFDLDDKKNKISKQAAENYIVCDSKLLKKILAINEGFSNDSKSNNDLLIDLTSLFLNTYNYCFYVMEKKYKSLVGVC